jgi:hypothetical protein
LNENIKISNFKNHLENKIIEMMKNIYKNVKLIDSDDKKVFFSGLNELSVILNKNSVSD